MNTTVTLKYLVVPLPGGVNVLAAPDQISPGEAETDETRLSDVNSQTFSQITLKRVQLELSLTGLGPPQVLSLRAALDDTITQRVFGTYNPFDLAIGPGWTFFNLYIANLQLTDGPKILAGGALYNVTLTLESGDFTAS